MMNPLSSHSQDPQVIKPTEQRVGQYLVWEATLQHAVSGYFTQVTGAQLPQLGCDGIFLHQGFLEGFKEHLWLRKTEHFNRCTEAILSFPPWCSGTAWGRQWTVTHTSLSVETLLGGSWSTRGTDCCYSVGTWRWEPAPGNTGTGAQDSEESWRCQGNVIMEKIAGKILLSNLLCDGLVFICFEIQEN